MPVYNVKPPIPLSIAQLLIQIASNPDNGFRVDREHNVIDRVELQEAEAQAYNLTFNNTTLELSDKELDDDEDESGFKH